MKYVTFPLAMLFCMVFSASVFSQTVADTEFAQKFADFRAMAEKVNALQSEYETAYKAQDNAKIAEIQKTGTTMMKQVEAAYIAAVPSALAAFETTDGKNEDLNSFIIGYAYSCLSNDDYENAYQILSKILKKGLQATHPEVVEMAGTAAFAANQFGAAKACFNWAKQQNKLTREGARYAQLAPVYEEAWLKEAQIRKQEDAAGDQPIVLIRTTAGDMRVMLFENEAPNTVANFISLVEKGYYNGLTFHRVLPGFMAQGGCPKGDGTGGPGYTIPCEVDNPLARKHFRGSLSMAHAGRDTGGSQFFITFLPTDFLDGKHTVFGRVIAGFDVLAKIEKIDPENPIPGQQPTKIIEMKVEKKRDHAYIPEKS